MIHTEILCFLLFAYPGGSTEELDHLKQMALTGYFHNTAKVEQSRAKYLNFKLQTSYGLCEVYSLKTLCINRLYKRMKCRRKSSLVTTVCGPLSVCPLVHDFSENDVKFPHKRKYEKKQILPIIYWLVFFQVKKFRPLCSWRRHGIQFCLRMCKFVFLEVLNLAAP